MPRKGHTEEQIIRALREAEGGKKAGDICRETGVSQQAFYSWRRRFAGLGLTELRELRRRDPQSALRLRLREPAGSRVRHGYRRLAVLLRREGWKVNTKRVYRLYREEGLQARPKKRAQRAAQARVSLPEAARPNQRWSRDFVSDR